MQTVNNKHIAALSTFILIFLRCLPQSFISFNIERIGFKYLATQPTFLKMFLSITSQNFSLARFQINMILGKNSIFRIHLRRENGVSNRHLLNYDLFNTSISSWHYEPTGSNGTMVTVHRIRTGCGPDTVPTLPGLTEENY